MNPQFIDTQNHAFRMRPRVGLLLTALLFAFAGCTRHAVRDDSSHLRPAAASQTEREGQAEQPDSSPIRALASSRDGNGPLPEAHSKEEARKASASVESPQEETSSDVGISQNPIVTVYAQPAVDQEKDSKAKAQASPVSLPRGEATTDESPEPRKEVATPVIDAEELYRRAKAQMSENDLAGASESLRQCLERHPGVELKIRAQYAFGIIAIMQRDGATAVLHWRAAIDSGQAGDILGEKKLRVIQAFLKRMEEETGS